MRSFSILALLIAVAMTAGSSPAFAQQQSWIFMTHAAFFADLTQANASIDPHVFVSDSSAAAGTGPENIAHVAGFRPENQGTDDHTSPLYNANGKALGFNIGKWLNSAGTVSVDSSGVGDRLHFGYTGLSESGHYDMFRFDPATGGISPLDGTGTTNAFTATSLGTADFYVTTPAHVTAFDRILLIYNSDGMDHSTQPGTFGVDSHVELVLRVKLV
jgi:hypothetical protein